MTIGTVAKNQVPMILTFRKDEVEAIAHILSENLEYAYQMIDFFQFPLDDDFDPFEDQ